MTQATSSSVAPRFPLMSLSATFTIDVSISSMIAAEITVNVMISLRSPCSAMAVPPEARHSVGDPDDRVHAHAGAQRVGGVGRLREGDLHGDPLGDLDEVPGGIVGGQKGEPRAGRPGDGLNLPVEDVPVVVVGFELDLLARLH